MEKADLYLTNEVENKTWDVITETYAPYNNNKKSKQSSRKIYTKMTPAAFTRKSERKNRRDGRGLGGESGTEDEEMTCGLGSCAPSWMQIFASKQAFLVIFCFTWVLQGMFATYFVSVITTIEKLFQLQSKTTGMIMSAIEFGQIGTTFLFTYYGGHGHRPRWIACGVLLFAICCLACSMPHFLYNFADFRDGNSTNLSAPPTNFCGNRGNNTFVTEACKADVLLLEENKSHKTFVVMIIFLFSLLGVGMGQAPVYTLGISYIDDNVASRESALYFAITIGVRILGPALGFILGSFCTRLYIDLSETSIKTTDTNWIGAWWLGLVLNAALLFIASIALFCFPRRLNKSVAAPPVTPAKVAVDVRHATPKLRDFPKTLKRLLKNDILMYRTASSVLHILPIAGLYTFLPKFLESQFRFPAHTANMVAGVGGILVMGIGIIISGVFILRAKPNPRFVAGWIAGAAFFYAIGMAILMFVGCPMDDMVGLKDGPKGGAMLLSECAGTCQCDSSKFSPICAQDLTYFSACHAGCRNVSEIDGNFIFSDCRCMRNNSDSSVVGSVATIGYCDSKCDNFVWYILIFSIFVFIHSTSEVGSMLLTLRCVDPRDKAMALGVIQFAIGLFGNVPCSIIYGAVVDSACLVWETVCGKVGACSLYDSTSFRQYFHGTTSGLMMCAFLIDLIVLYKADNINFPDEEQITANSPSNTEELIPVTDKSTDSETTISTNGVKSG